MCKTNRDHKNTYLSKLPFQAVVVSQMNFACFQNGSSICKGRWELFPHVSPAELLEALHSFSCQLPPTLANGLGGFSLSYLEGKRGLGDVLFVAAVQRENGDVSLLMGKKLLKISV